MNEYLPRKSSISVISWNNDKKDKQTSFAIDNFSFVEAKLRFIS